MKKQSSTRWLSYSLLLLLGGCSSSPQFVQSAAQTARAAQYFDTLYLAVRRENIEETLPLSEQLIRNGSEQYLLQWARNMTRRSDAEMLNSIGYTWADKGNQSAQFQAAEILTRRAIELASADVKSAQETGVQPFIIHRRYQRAMIRDSLAWALFKQKRFDEALEEQKQAVAEMLEIAEGRSFGAEIYYHLGEIYAALGQNKEARQSYNSALRDNPNYQPAQQALEKIKPKAAM